MSKYLFQEKIENWDDWGDVFQSIAVFTPLIKHIFEKHNLAKSISISHLTPGTNAVFAVNETYVIKIFAPKESGIGDAGSPKREMMAQAYAEAQGILTPKTLAKGMIKDKYDFFYAITERLTGQEFHLAMQQMTNKEKRQYGAEIRKITDALHHEKSQAVIPRIDLLAQTLGNQRWREISPLLAAELKALAETLDLTAGVLNHGDLNEDNILVSPTGALYVIDFGDAVIAPAYYELPPIVFELFREDKTLIAAFLGKDDRQLFFENLTCGLALHDFGGDIIAQFCKRNGIDAMSIQNIELLKEKIEAVLF
ncbi:MAG: aminoglycoside phosphotransferase family protein [Christensenellaceae bacterium]